MLLWHAIWLFSVSWGVCQHLGSPKSGLYCSFCVHIAVCVCVCMYEHTCTVTNSGATPAQATTPFKKKAFKRIIWLIPLHSDKNIPESEKMNKLPFPKNLRERTLQPPINDVLDFQTTLIMEKFFFATF